MNAIEAKAAYHTGEIAGQLIAIEMYDPAVAAECELRWQRLLDTLDAAQDKMGQEACSALRAEVLTTMADRP